MATDIPVDTSTLGDTSKYIRTYAKDMAALSAKGGVPVDDKNAKPKKEKLEPAKTSVSISPPTPPKKVEKESVVVQEPEPAFFSRQVPRAEREEVYQKAEALPSKKELDSIFERKAASIPSTIEPGPVPLMPKKERSVPSAAPSEPKAERESILARLRARLSKDAEMDIQPMSSPKMPELTPPPVSAPIVKEEPIPTPVLAPAMPATPEPIAYVPPAPVISAPESILPPTPPATPVIASVPIPEPVPTPPIPEPVPVVPVPEPEPIPVPEIIAPKEEPVVPPAPPPVIETPIYREPIPEEVTVPVFTPPPPPLPRREPVISSRDEASPLHTYTTDFAGRIDERGASTFSVLAAQADAGQLHAQPAPLSKKRFAWVPVALGVVLLLGGGTGLVLAYQYVSKLHAVPQASPNAPSLIFVDGKIELKGTGTDLLNALAQAETTSIPDGKVVLTYVTQSTTTPKGIASFIPAPGGSLIRALQLPAPDILLRNIDPASTVGVVHAGSETKAFFLLRVTSYQSTFAGMLTWEPVMWRDLAVLYPLYPAVDIVTPVTIATTTTSSTASTTNGTTTTTVSTQPAVQVQAGPRAVFEDAVVASHDVRILHDTNGRTLLLYGYYDKQTLIIARDEAAFTLLLNRLSATTVQ